MKLHWVKKCKVRSGLYSLMAINIAILMPIKQ